MDRAANSRPKAIQIKLHLEAPNQLAAARKRSEFHEKTNRKKYETFRYKKRSKTYLSGDQQVTRQQAGLREGLRALAKAAEPAGPEGVQGAVVGDRARVRLPARHVLDLLRELRHLQPAHLAGLWKVPK